MCQASTMLTKKQFWRRQGSLTNAKDQDAVKRSFSDDTYLGLPPNTIPSTSTSRSSSIDDIGSKGKSVAFSPYVRVILIPSARDYKSANLDQLLWWNATDYHGFKTDAIAEVRHFLDHHHGMDGREAIRQLYYAPHPDDDKQHHHHSTAHHTSTSATSSAHVPISA